MGWQEDQNPKTQAAATKALGEEEMLPAPKPREGWSSEGLKEMGTAQLGNPPQGYQVNSRGPGYWDVEWEDGATERLREGDRSDRYPGHEVTGFYNEPNAQTGRPTDRTMEMTPPYDSGSPPYILRNTQGEGEEDLSALQPFYNHHRIAQMEQEGGASPAHHDADVDAIIGSPRDQEFDAILGAAEAQGWDERTTKAVLGAREWARESGVEGFELLSTSEAHVDGAPDNIYFRDGDGNTWEAALDPSPGLTPAYAINPATSEDP